MSDNIITLAKIGLDVQNFEYENRESADNTFVLTGVQSGEFSGADGTEYTYSTVCTTTITKKSDILLVGID